jgi:CMP-N,N'-diacetyllegionaminic acid synthase
VFKEKKIIALIPARGGSKGLPRKNILPFVGKPLIAWTIEQAIASNCLARVIVSTDDDEIAEVAKKYRADVPFIRPKELATDDATASDVISHAVDYLLKHDGPFDILLLLQPTSPLRTSQDIDNAIALLFAKKAKAVVSVCEAEHHPYWSNTLPEDGCMKDFIRPDIMHKNRQELPAFYRINGAIYLTYCDYLQETKSFFGKKTYAYIMPLERSIDIDTKVDFRLAEILKEETGF